MSVDHYENFPVASLLCPKPLRPAIKAIYWFARTADDMADEGNFCIATRLKNLQEYRLELFACFEGNRPHQRWHKVFTALQNAHAQHQFALSHFERLLDAFDQDASNTQYANRFELLAYCNNSATPIGQLLLHLYGINDSDSLAQSDAICTGLQLANFWQDLSIDLPRSRLNLPLADCQQHQLDMSSLWDLQDSVALHKTLAELVKWARSLLLFGAPLTETFRRKAGSLAGLELRLVIQGGLMILEKIEQLNYATVIYRPELSTSDMPKMLWRAFRMNTQAFEEAKYFT
jgi:hydroxysqualene synthase